MLAPPRAHSAAMSESLFIKKRQRDRRKHSFLTIKLILRLVVSSVLLWLGFMYFVGDPTTSVCENGCESEFGFNTWALAIVMIFGGIILIAGLAGALIALIRRNRASSSLSVFLDEKDDSEPT